MKNISCVCPELIHNILETIISFIENIEIFLGNDF